MISFFLKTQNDLPCADDDSVGGLRWQIESAECVGGSHWQIAFADWSWNYDVNFWKDLRVDII